MKSTQQFLSAKSFAVAGASNDRQKFGNKVFVALLQSGRNVVPLNPREETIEGQPAYASVAQVPIVPEALSIVTPPPVTRSVVQEAIAMGVKHLWMQPGAEDSQSSEWARDAGLNVIDDGSCILVALKLE